MVVVDPILRGDERPINRLNGDQFSRL